MQVLTGQYPKLYTHKLRVFYTDFQPSGSNVVSIDLLTLPSAVQVVNTAWRPTAAWKGISLSSAIFHLFQSGQVPPNGVNTGTLATFNAFGALTDIFGSLQPASVKLRANPSNGQNIWNSYTSPTMLKLRLSVNSGININALSSGALDIWVVVMKMP